MESLEESLSKSILDLDTTIKDLQRQRNQLQIQLDLVKRFNETSSSSSSLLNHQNVNPSEQTLGNTALGNNLIVNKSNNVIATTNNISLHSTSSSQNNSSNSIVLNNNNIINNYTNNNNYNNDDYYCAEDWQSNPLSTVNISPPSSTSSNTTSNNNNSKKSRKQNLEMRKTSSDTIFVVAKSLPSSASSSSSSSAAAAKKPKIDEIATTSTTTTEKHAEAITINLDAENDNENGLFEIEDLEDYLADDNNDDSNNNTPELYVMEMDTEPAIQKRKLLNAERQSKGQKPLSLKLYDYDVCSPFLRPFDAELDNDLLLNYHVLLLSILIYKARVLFYINGHVCTTSDAICLASSKDKCGTIREIVFEFDGEAVSLMTTEFTKKIILVNPKLSVRFGRNLVRTGILQKHPENLAAKNVNHRASPPNHHDFNDQVSVIVQKKLKQVCKIPEVRAIIQQQKLKMAAEIGRAPTEKAAQILKDSAESFFCELGGKTTETTNVGRMQGKVGGPSKKTSYKFVKYRITYNVGVRHHVHPVTGRLVKYETREEDGHQKCPVCDTFVKYMGHHNTICGKVKQVASLETAMENDADLILYNQKMEEKKKMDKNRLDINKVQEKKMETSEEYRRTDFTCGRCHRHFTSEFFLEKHLKVCTKCV